MTSNKKKVVGYVRLSEEDRKRAEGDRLISLENQKEDIKNFCERNGFKLLNIFDEGIAKSQDWDRLQFNMMLKLAEIKEMDAIVVTSDDRFARDPELLLNKLKFLRVYKVKLLDLSGTDFTADLTMSAFKGAISAEAVEKARKKQGMMMERFERQGKFLGKLPYGYRNVKKIVGGRVINSVRVDSAKAKKVREMFKMYLEGWMVVDIASRYGFSRRHIYNVLKNKAYMGIMVMKKKSKLRKKIVNVDEIEYKLKGWSKIVDIDVFNKVQKKLGENKLW